MSPELNRAAKLGSVLRFTLPAMLMMLVMSLYSVVDGVFVARLVGPDALSAVNIAYPLLGLSVGMGTMFGSGTAAIAATLLGEGKELQARQTVSFVMLSAGIFCAAFSTVSIIFLDDLLRLLGANEVIFPYCRAYALPLLICLPANLLQLAFQSLFMANGTPRLGLYVILAGGFMNIVLDYLFIAIFGWGIAGAAYATAVGWLVPTLFSIAYFCTNKKANLRFAWPTARFKTLFLAMGNGSSEMVGNLSGSITMYLFNITMMRLVGQSGVAAIAVILYLDFMLIALTLGYAMGVAPLFSFNYGAGNHKRLKKLFRLSIGICGGMGLLMAAINFFFAPQLATIFAKPGTEVYDLARVGLRLFSPAYLFMGLNIFTSALFTAFSNGKVSAFISFMRTLVMVSGSILILSTLFGVTGVWLALPVAEALSFTLSVICLRKYRKVYNY